jgi:hypothetical protein
MSQPTRAPAVEFVDNREKDLFEIARRGEAVRAFLQSNSVGQLLHARAKEMIRQAEQDALEVDPDGWSWFRSRTKLRQIRQRATIARLFINWLGEAILEGDQASGELEDYRT